MATEQVSTKTLLDVYRTMVTIRLFEEAVLDLRNDDQVAGSVHPACGQEAIPAAAVAQIEDGDRVVATYRGHGWAIACGIPLDRLLAEICGRATGVNGGRGGSPYLSAPEHGFVGENSIVGAGLPIAAGVALAAQVRGTDRVTLVSFGDGATNQGAAHEGLVFAAARSLPVVFVCENNGWSEMTPISATTRVERLAERAAGYGMPGATIDGNDAEAVAAAVDEAISRARAGEGPTFLECRTTRLRGHYNADIEHYRPQADRDAAREADPIPTARRTLLDHELAVEDELAVLEAEAADAVAAARRSALAAPFPDPATAREHVVAHHRSSRRSPGYDGGPRELSYGLALNLALELELEERPETIVFGEDVGVPGGVFGVSRNLQKQFGASRVFDTPIAEAAILGAAVGASMEGLRPVAEVMWSDFLLVALDQLVNQAANVRYLSSGRTSAPLVVRCQQGATPGSCAQHSQSLEALLAHIPGLRVGMPATAQDAYSMLRAAIADPDPVVIIESRALYGEKGIVDPNDVPEAIGGARVLREGGDVSIVSWGRMTHRVSEAAEELAARGIEADVLDLRWLDPLDMDAVTSSVRKTSRALVVHEANQTGGFGGEVVSRIVQQNFEDLDAPPVRLGSPDVRFPSAPVLQDALLPSAGAIVAAAVDLVGA
jgi:2-oxoisovalerate dehydrogenase E1 component